MDSGLDASRRPGSASGPGWKASWQARRSARARRQDGEAHSETNDRADALDRRGGGVGRPAHVMPDRRKCIAVAANSIAKITKAPPLNVAKARTSPRPHPPNQDSMASATPPMRNTAARAV